MKCVIPGAGIKAFGKAIFCLSKIGEELYIEGLEDGLALKTVNTARSAFACFLFEKKFFHSYRDSTCGRGSGRGSDSEEEGGFKCKISARSVLSVFRALHTLERTVDRCNVNLDLKENKLVFIFHCKHGVVKTHSLGYQECEALQAVFSKDLCPNHLSAPAKVLSEVVTHFPSSLEEVTLTALPTSITLRNYVEDDGEGSRPSLTEICLAPDEFDHYQVGVDAAITFCLKELRAILAFTDAINQSLSLRFEEPGRPIVLSIENARLYKADFVMATLLDGNSSHQHTTSIGHNRTATTANSTIPQNQANEFESFHNETTMQHSQNENSEMLPETIPKRTRPIRTLSASADIDFPSGSQFGRPGNVTPATTSAKVPPPPSDLDFMDIEYNHNEIEEQGQSNAPSENSHLKKSVDSSVPRKIDSVTSKNSTEKQLVSAIGSHGDTMEDDFDVMDAIFGVENRNDVAEEGNQFGFGVERQDSASVRRHEKENVRILPKVSLTQDGVEEVMGSTLGNVIDDSGFIPRSPPAKKAKPLSYTALLGLTMFSSEHNRSDVLAPDSDDEQ